MANRLQEEAACPVCQEVFLNPIALSCAHTFCFDCMQSWMEEQKDLKLICPVCRGVNENPPLEEWQVGELILLITQHGSQLEQGLHVNDEYLKFWEDITLDAATANPFLVLSDDLRSVQCGKICQNLIEDPQRFAYWACILGTPCFSSGCHYWVVEVGEGNEWALGVCKKSVDRKRKSGFSSEHGFWIISMKAGIIYTCSIPETRIPASPGLSQVGIFLDIELEEIKFFDVSNDALIYIHSNFSCLEPLCPFFSPELPREGDNGGPLTICPSGTHPFLETSCEVNEISDVRNVRMTEEETIL
ncbi:ret finger protein-like 4B [Sagmatias obliquidens]|uniref:ret finger protein-like 4B n=1 Tax=Sagmatias obliquidens TaxID=3371155 RepID=UPI000F43F463|nr:ret finger protein-like 4B [Lagenorhynchus obliquidens]